MTKVSPEKCRCGCHKDIRLRHIIPCCCNHKFKHNCPYCFYENYSVARDRE